MFDLYCPHCSTRRLMFAGQVRGLVNETSGAQVLLECWCGGLVRWDSATDSAAAEVTPTTSALPADVRVPQPSAGRVDADLARVG